MLLFTSDLHLGHANILSSRPQFRNIEEHDQYLLKRWNEKVKRTDEVYILGDLSFRSSRHISYYLSQMKGRKHLLVGNHDDYWLRNVENPGEYFESVQEIKQLKFDKKKITLCHYPMLEWPGSRYAENGSSFLIHGHIHGSKTETFYYIKEHLLNAWNAGADVNDFEPVTFEKLQENNRRWYGR